MQALAVFGRPVPPAAVDYLLQPHQPGVDSAPLLGRLVNMHFARNEAGRYYLHPVDREYALSRIAPGEVADRWTGGPRYTRYGLLHRAAEYFKQSRLSRENWKSIEDFAPQLAEFDLRCDGQDYETAARVLAEISSECLMRWGWSRRVVELNARVLGKLNDPGLESSMQSIQGNAYQLLGQPKRAISYHEQALVLARKVGNRRIESNNLGDLGLCYWLLGETASAIDYHERALAIRREVGDRHGEGTDLGDLGLCYRPLGETARAIDYHERALAIRREIGDRHGEGITLGNLGNCFKDLGQTAHAIDYLERALALKREVGDRFEEGTTLGNLGQRFGDLGQTARAIDYLNEALTILREVGNRPGEGICHYRLASLLISEGRHEDAIQQAIDAVKIGSETGSLRIMSRGNECMALARLCRNDLMAARTAAEAARVADVARTNHIVQSLLGLIALRQGDRTASAEDFQAAIAHADVMLQRSAQNYEALDAKGLALAGLAVLERGDNTAEAIAAFRAARAITSAPGIVGRVKRLLDAMAPADAAGILAPVFEAAEGREVAIET
jgi:tetratricopeptide (TPR) repeat protein